MAKPAARATDSTACPLHGSNPIASGSPNVLFDNLPAARMGDPSACGGALAGNVVPNVLINSKPAATIGSVGAHGNVVVAGSAIVQIGGKAGAPAIAATPRAASGALTEKTLAAKKTDGRSRPKRIST